MASVEDLSDDERSWYLRSTGMIEVNDAVRGLAAQAVGGVTAPDEQARRLYHYIIAEYNYKWPPASRGSESIRRTRTGDCGEYSHLFAALCRALAIPCRVLYGTWALGETEAHAWNEVYLPQRGWVVVDTSGDQLSVTGWLVAWNRSSDSTKPDGAPHTMHLRGDFRVHVPVSGAENTGDSGKVRFEIALGLMLRRPIN